MAITDWPEMERPREKLLKRGAEALSDAELLAIFLRTGVKGKTAVDLARELLKQFDGLRNLLQADWQDFQHTKGLGIAKYAQFQAILEMGRRHLEQIIARQDAMLNPVDTRRYLTAKLRQYPHEVFACLYLDVRMQVIHFEILAQGTLDSVEPSEADFQLTKQLKQALALVDIQVLDHIIIGEGETLSFAEQGWIE
jgi:DNA repair protein RadC